MTRAQTVLSGLLALLMLLVVASVVLADGDAAKAPDAAVFPARRWPAGFSERTSVYLLFERPNGPPYYQKVGEGIEAKLPPDAEVDEVRPFAGSGELAVVWYKRKGKP